ncbi:unnamed protein product [Cuscuta epithymum]|nr:unnamed protein product [Cuscuta epithymum]
MSYNIPLISSLPSSLDFKIRIIGDPTVLLFYEGVTTFQCNSDQFGQVTVKATPTCYSQNLRASFLFIKNSLCGLPNILKPLLIHKEQWISYFVYEGYEELFSEHHMTKFFIK